jgi:alpha-L-rhamnosidase
MFGYLVVAALGAASPVKVSVEDLTVEHLTQPLGVDVSSPSFGYRLLLADPALPSSRGVAQSKRRLVIKQTESGTVCWDSGTVVSNMTYGIRSDCKLQSDTHYTWTVQSWLNDGSEATSSSSTFHTAIWHMWNATWIVGGVNPAASVQGLPGVSPQVNLLRKTFTVPDRGPSPPQRATLVVAGIGYNEVSLNGHAVSDHKLDSGWTDFTKRVVYSTFDVTHLLASGKNAIGVALGNGWWSCGPPPGTSQPDCDKTHPPQLLLQLQAGGPGGDPPLVVSDLTWRSAPGPITYDSLYNGENFDGRRARALAGWDTAGFDDSDWTPAAAASSPANTAVLSSALFEPTRHLATFAPKVVTSPQPNVQVFDFGQNLAGVVRLTDLKCPAGANVTIRHAELLQHPPYGPVDGSIYVGNLRNARATDVYTCVGDESGEGYVPTFTQHGFRYAEVSGLDGPLDESQVSAIEMHTDIRQHSSVQFSHPLLNQIQHNVIWGQKSNVMSGVATDCPQRDERRGWTGDAALTAEEAVYNFMMGAVYTRWLLQYEDDQTATGASNNFVPALATGAGAPNWQSAYPSIVWALFKYYGDIGPAETHHASLVKYYDNLARQYNATGVKGYATGFGDWVPPPPQPMGDKHLIGAFALLHDLRMGSEFFAASSVVGAAAQAARCSELFSKAAADFHSTWWVSEQGYYANGLQTEQAMALYLDIVPSGLKAGLLDYVVHDIMVTHNKHTTSGIIGIKCMLEVLAANGRTDIALQMLLEESYPSYGYMIKGGQLGIEPATTIWELWDSDQEGPGMNSRNHIMFGTVSSFFYKWLVGVRPLKPGYTEVGVHPTGVLSGNLTDASASVWTPLGDVVVEWGLSIQGTTCASAPEGGMVHLSCPADAISKVTFASYGLPTGQCTGNGGANDFHISSKCNSNASVSTVQAACVGKSSCDLDVSTDTFGSVDPCYGTKKALAVAVECKGGVRKSYTLKVSIPLGATGKVAVTAASLLDVTISEGLGAAADTVVWSKGKYIAGAPGVSSATPLPGLEPAVEFEVASGTYWFTAVW